MVVKKKGEHRKAVPSSIYTVPKLPGIKEIARVAKVSIGTVDRALHGRARIDAATRDHVLETARQLGYRPNLAARSLKLSRQYRISVNLPLQIASFFGALQEGIQEAASRLQPQLEIDLRTYPRMGQGEVECFQAALDSNCHGIILVPGSPSKMLPLMRIATRSGIPVICVATDAPETGRVTCVCSDSFTSGAIAAELLHRFAGNTPEVAIVTGDLATFDHSEKVRGFRSVWDELGSVRSSIEVEEAHDDVREARQQTLDLLRRRPNLRGIYVSTANSLAVVETLEKTGRLGEVAIIATDLFPGLVPLIRSGKIFATIHQRPRTQGRMAFEALHRLLLERVTPRRLYKLVPHIVLRSNLELFLENAFSEAEVDGAATLDVPHNPFGASSVRGERT
jgi:LacI family transcriptional regulator